MYHITPQNCRDVSPGEMRAAWLNFHAAKEKIHPLLTIEERRFFSALFSRTLRDLVGCLGASVGLIKWEVAVLTTISKAIVPRTAIAWQKQLGLDKVPMMGHIETTDETINPNQRAVLAAIERFQRAAGIELQTTPPHVVNLSADHALLVSTPTTITERTRLQVLQIDWLNDVSSSLHSISKVQETVGSNPSSLPCSITAIPKGRFIIHDKYRYSKSDQVVIKLAFFAKTALPIVRRKTPTDLAKTPAQKHYLQLYPPLYQVERYSKKRKIFVMEVGYPLFSGPISHILGFKLPLATIKTIALELLETVAKLHEAGFAHTKISPDHILLKLSKEKGDFMGMMLAGWSHTIQKEGNERKFLEESLADIVNTVGIIFILMILHDLDCTPLSRVVDTEKLREALREEKTRYGRHYGDFVKNPKWKARDFLQFFQRYFDSPQLYEIDEDWELMQQASPQKFFPTSQFVIHKDCHRFPFDVLTDMLDQDGEQRLRHVLVESIRPKLEEEARGAGKTPPYILKSLDLLPFEVAASLLKKEPILDHYLEHLHTVGNPITIYDLRELAVLLDFMIKIYQRFDEHTLFCSDTVGEGPGTLHILQTKEGYFLLTAKESISVVTFEENGSAS